MVMSFVMSVDELKDKLAENSNDTVIVDVRFELTNPEAGRKAYEENHIPGAFYLSLDEDLSGEIQEHGGNHPLPDVEEFAKKLGNIGIDSNTTVVVYDQSNDMFAARLWWMLHYLGHDHVYVLDGGFEHWLANGNAATADIPTPTKKAFKPQPRSNEVIHIQEVKEKLKTKSAVLIDSRARERYLGQVEPLYKKAGHIPGAKNYFWKNVFDHNGRWKSKETLEKQFSSLSKDDEIIVSCGSGVSATPNILALKMAGYQNIKLYPGSFSDWISYEKNDVATEEE